MAATESPGTIVLPALRGMMGNWVYYCCLMDLASLASRVHYARDLHKSEQLSQMIQRTLEDRRSKEIAEYLETRPDRLFNALIVATYGGHPNWHALTNVQSIGSADELGSLTDDTMQSVGFLTLSGDEKLFALDGQHRLAGIKRAASDHLPGTDMVPVMFVSHKNTEEGLRRTRRLFTTLNKTARRVSRFGIIALDEDDVMALTIRHLIDENPDMFGGERIAFIGTSNMPQSHFESLTTIVNLYDILRTFFSQADTPLRKPLATLRKGLPYEELQSYYDLALEFFDELKRGFPELLEFFDAEDTEPVVRGYRNRNALYRPAGLRAFAAVVAHLTWEMDLASAVAEAAKLPRSFDADPFAKLMWNPATQTIRRFQATTLLDLLLHMLGRPQREEHDLLQRYRHEVGDDSLELPNPVL